MKNKFDNILLVFLWLLAVMLVGCIWFNIKFGFNIFSGAHWQHLAYMQASQSPIQSAFYISLCATIIIGLGGTYMLLRPRKNHQKIQPQKNVYTHESMAQTQNQTTQALPKEPELERPRRLNISAPSTTPPQAFNIAQPQAFTAPPPQTTITPIVPPVTTPQISNPSPDTQILRDEIGLIFSSAGYILKPSAKIANTQTALLALGTNETIWIGAIGTSTDKMTQVVNELDQVFSDTLDDIYIKINAFIISPDKSSPTNNTIMTFDTINELRTYMQSHPNPPIDESDTENFDAFSTYISTVIDYIGKL